MGVKKMPDHCMQKALEYIDNHIMSDISLNDIAFEAGFSVPQFYRLFKRLTGDTLGSYILRRKLIIASREVKDGNKSISSIAFDYGFSSHDVFTRAFIRVFGISPKEYRKVGEIPPLKRYSVEYNEQEKDAYQMEFRIVNLPGFEVIGLECNAEIWDGNGNIGKLWNEFLMRMEEINPLHSSATMYGICEHEYCDSKHFKYMAAVGINKAEKVPQDMVIRHIKPQTYFQAGVPASISVPDAYSAAIGYAKSLGYEIEDYDNIEVYDEAFKDPAYYSFELLIPVK
ncbi:MAG: AraC family transcriptional regulator [Anaerocolumna jejuensis]